MEIPAIDSVFVEYSPKRGLRRADKWWCFSGHERDLSYCSFVREEDVEGLPYSLPNTGTSYVVNAARALEAHPSVRDIGSPNETGPVLNKLMGARSVLTVIAILDK